MAPRQNGVKNSSQDYLVLSRMHADDASPRSAKSEPSESTEATAQSAGDPVPTIEQLCPHAEGVYAWQNLLVLMCWPQDPEEQLQARRANHLQNLRSAEARAATDEEYLVICAALEPIRRQLGGWCAMAEAPAYSDVQEAITERMKDGQVAGFILRLMYALHTQSIPMDGGPSLNKVLEFIRVRGRELLGQDRLFTKANLLAIWAEYRPVAHLWAAHLSLQRKHFPPIPDPESITDPVYQLFDRRLANYLLGVYRMAKKLQEFGLGFKAKRARIAESGFLDPDEIYCLGDIPGWQDFVIPPLVFAADWLETFKSYQAPKIL